MARAFQFNFLPPGLIYFLFLSTPSDQLSAIMHETISAMNAPATRIAMLCSPEEASNVGRGVKGFTVAVTLWTCLQPSNCHDSFVRYATQVSLFRRPALVIVPRAETLPSGIYEEIVLFETYHANVRWIFSVANHTEVFDKLSKHICHVVTVNENEINIPSDEHRYCRTRKVFRTMNATLSPYTWRKELFPKNHQIYYGIMDKPGNYCAYKTNPDVPVMLEAYTALNNTMTLRCDVTADSGSLILNRIVDVILGPHSVNCGFSNIVSDSDYGCFFYAHAAYPPRPVCLVVPTARPVPPSFSNTWLRYFGLFLVLSFIAAVAHFTVVRISIHWYGESTIRSSDVSIVFVSSFLGRSPPPRAISRLETNRVLLGAWMLGVFILLNILQSQITASRAIPAQSAEIRSIEDFMARLHAGRILPCMPPQIANAILKSVSNVSYIQSVRKVLKSCGKSCSGPNYCFPKIRKRTHVGLGGCGKKARRKFDDRGTVSTEEIFMSYFGTSQAHGKFPLR
ncbi:hypothetical protein HPB48_000083 [Haemaphysalis longicornis]|uniref:Uncharacterized protein n=1 Tax=Haemaphysalis longicornis TaxID=44386 RepID=A0A9J6G2J4_HAELO|nr:hypothetical protein HPB48_000083 [Haemaphysalis longicornis]